jgi:hypothetical protein
MHKVFIAHSFVLNVGFLFFIWNFIKWPTIGLAAFIFPVYAVGASGLALLISIIGGIYLIFPKLIEALLKMKREEDDEV